MISLAQMGQCNGCGSVRKDLYSTQTWDSVQALEVLLVKKFIKS